MLPGTQSCISMVGCTWIWILRVCARLGIFSAAPGVCSLRQNSTRQARLKRNMKSGSGMQMPFFASPPGHPVLNEALRRMPAKSNKGVLAATGPGMLTESIRAAPASSVHVSPVTTFYGYQWNDPQRCTTVEACLLLNNTAMLTVSFWTGTWLKAQ